MSESTDRADMRASDADRQVVVARLRRAHDEGRLTLGEFDERVREVWAAITYRELGKATADLPPDLQAAQQPAPGPVAMPELSRPVERAHQANLPARRSGGRFKRVAIRTWLAVSLLNFVIWAMVSLGEGVFVYPWFIWVFGPLGALIVAVYMIGGGDQER